MVDRDLFSCKAKTAMVSGGAGLLGSEIARALAKLGAVVYIADKDQKRAEAMCKCTHMNYILLDIGHEESVTEAIETVVRDGGGIDILVNCAYPRTLDWGKPVGEVAFGSWKDNVNSHLGGYFLCCRKAAEKMKERGGGAIINLASIYGVVAPDFSLYEGSGMTNAVEYSAIKGGIIALTRYLATYYAKHNIRVNAISPGGIYDGQPPEFVEKYSRRAPLGRMGKPEDVAGAVIYLASDASSYVTGHNLIVDGGWTIW